MKLIAVSEVISLANITLLHHVTKYQTYSILEMIMTANNAVQYNKKNVHKVDRIWKLACVLLTNNFTY